MTMGTASTMTSAWRRSAHAARRRVDTRARSRHAQMATLTGKRIVEMVWEDLKPLEVATAAAFRQRGHHGAGTRRVDQFSVHLVALARRATLR